MASRERSLGESRFSVSDIKLYRKRYDTSEYNIIIINYLNSQRSRVEQQRTCEEAEAHGRELAGEGWGRGGGRRGQGYRWAGLMQALLWCGDMMLMCVLERGAGIMEQGLGLSASTRKIARPKLLHFKLLPFISTRRVHRGGSRNHGL